MAWLGIRLSTMTLWQGSKAELVTAIAAAIGIPFYLGFIHTAVPHLVLYSGVAGTAMATGEFAECRSFSAAAFACSLRTRLPGWPS